MVEWKKLGDVCSFNRGRTITAKDAIEGAVPVIAGGQTPSYYHNEANRSGESITVAGSGAYAGFIAFWNQPIFVSDAFTVDPIGDLLHKYVFQWLKMNQQRIFDTQKGAGVPHVHGKDIANFMIPVPSFSEQNQIVRFLDIFTASIENLKQQVAERRKQFEHYRDQLLDLEGKDGVVLKSLGELSELVTKQTGFDYSSKIKPELLTKKEEGSIPFLQTRNFNGRNFEYETQYYVPNHIVNQFPKIVLDKECLLLSIVGASIGNVGLFPGKTKCFLGGAICVLKFKNNVNIPFVYEVMSSWYGQRLIQSKIKGAGQATITVEDIRNFEIPLPSFEEQSRIVSILETFEASIANLEAQLKEREKQYEYYRNKLLTFE